MGQALRARSGSPEVDSGPHRGRHDEYRMLSGAAFHDMFCHHNRPPHSPTQSPGMTDTPIRLSPSEKQTLKDLAAGEHDPSDWVALQHLKRLGLAEEQGTGRVKITTEGMRVLRDLDHR